MSVSNEIQEIIKKIVLDGDEQTGKLFTLDFIRRVLYGDLYHQDSSRQKAAVYNSVSRNRKKAIEEINSRIMDPNYFNELREIAFTRHEEVDTSTLSDAYKQYFDDLLDGKIVDDPEIIELMIETDPVHAVWWKDRVIELAKQGHCLLIPNKYGKEPSWKLECCFFDFSIRDREVAERFWLSMSSVLKRMVKTRQKLPSAIPVARLLEQMTIVKAALEDGTTWTCPNCSINSLR